MRARLSALRFGLLALVAAMASACGRAEHAPQGVPGPSSTSDPSTSTTNAGSSDGTTAVLDTTTTLVDTTSTGSGEAGVDASSDTGSDSSTNTTGAAPVCGDGVLDPGEECDARTSRRRGNARRR